MKFAQMIEFTTERIDDFNAGLDEWMAAHVDRTPHRAVLRRDRDAEDRYLFMVEFASYEQGMRIRCPARGGGVRRSGIVRPTMILWCRSTYPDLGRNAAVARVAHMAFKLAGGPVAVCN